MGPYEEINSFGIPDILISSAKRVIAIANTASLKKVNLSLFTPLKFHFDMPSLYLDSLVAILS